MSVGIKGPRKNDREEIDQTDEEFLRLKVQRRDPIAVILINPFVPKG
jgi:hypothetical protein